MKLINLTPHSINLCGLKIESSGQARVSEKEIRIGEVVNDEITIPITKRFFGDVVGLPDPQPNTIFIVSSLVQSRCNLRTDVVALSRFQRDEAGNILSAGGLTQ